MRTFLKGLLLAIGTISLPIIIVIAVALLNLFPSPCLTYNVVAVNKADAPLEDARISILDVDAWRGSIPAKTRIYIPLNLLLTGPLLLEGRYASGGARVSAESESMSWEYNKYSYRVEFEAGIEGASAKSVFNDHDDRGFMTDPALGRMSCGSHGLWLYIRSIFEGAEAYNPRAYPF